VDTLLLCRHYVSCKLNEHNQVFQERFSEFVSGTPATNLPPGATAALPTAAGLAAAAAAAGRETEYEGAADDEEEAEVVDLQSRKAAQRTRRKSSGVGLQPVPTLLKASGFIKGGYTLRSLGQMTMQRKTLVGYKFHSAEGDTDLLHDILFSNDNVFWPLIGNVKGTWFAADFSRELSIKFDKTMAEMYHVLQGGWIKHDGRIPRELSAKYGPQIFPDREMGNKTGDRHAYSGPRSGPKGHAAKLHSDLSEYFLAQFTDEFLESIAHNINQYATEDWVCHNAKGYVVPCTHDKVPGHPRWHRWDGPGRSSGKKPWVPVTAGEVLLVIGCRIRQATKGTRTVTQDFVTSQGLQDSEITKYITRERFEDILRFLHFADNTAVVPGSTLPDPLYKIRPLLDHMNKVMPRTFQAGETIAIDESRIVMESRAGQPFMRVNPNKPIKAGMNLFAVCDSETGVLLQVIPQVTGGVQAKDAVLALVDGIGPALLKDRIVLTDSLYTNTATGVALHEREIGMAGTVQMRMKSNDPTKVYANSAYHKIKKSLAANIPRGQHSFALKEVDGVLFMSAAVKDNNYFSLLTTRYIHHITPTNKFTAQRRDGESVESVIEFASFPAHLLYLYNFNGVDVLDRAIAEFSTQYRSKRYYIRVFWYLVDVVCYFAWRCVQSFLQEVTSAPQHHPQRWSHYKTGTHGCGARMSFMLDLGSDVIRRGVAMRDAERPPAPVRHHLGTWDSHERCKVCEMVAAELLPQLPQNERRRFVLSTGRFCKQCDSMPMCQFCFEHNWDHRYSVLRPRKDLSISRKRKVAALKSPTPPTTPSPPRKLQRADNTTKQTPRRSYKLETEAAKARREQRSSHAKKNRRGDHLPRVTGFGAHAHYGQNDDEDYVPGDNEDDSS
jgi:hypothetical protein